MASLIKGLRSFITGNDALIRSVSSSSRSAIAAILGLPLEDSIEASSPQVVGGHEHVAASTIPLHTIGLKIKEILGDGTLLEDYVLAVVDALRSNQENPPTIYDVYDALRGLQSILGDHLCVAVAANLKYPQVSLILRKSSVSAPAPEESPPVKKEVSPITFVLPESASPAVREVLTQDFLRKICANRHAAFVYKYVIDRYREVHPDATVDDIVEVLRCIAAMEPPYPASRIVAKNDNDKLPSKIQKLLDQRKRFFGKAPLVPSAEMGPSSSGKPLAGIPNLNKRGTEERIPALQMLGGQDSLVAGPQLPEESQQSGPDALDGETAVNDAAAGNNAAGDSVAGSEDLALSGLFSEGPLGEEGEDTPARDLDAPPVPDLQPPAGSEQPPTSPEGDATEEEETEDEDNPIPGEDAPIEPVLSESGTSGGISIAAAEQNCLHTTGVDSSTLMIPSAGLKRLGLKDGDVDALSTLLLKAQMEGSLNQEFIVDNLEIFFRWNTTALFEAIDLMSVCISSDKK